MTLRVGVIGTGMIGPGPHPAARPRCCRGAGHRGHRRGDPDAPRRWPSRWAHARTPPASDLIDDAAVDAVVVCLLGARTHEQYVLACDRRPASRCSARSRWPPPARTPCRSSRPRWPSGGGWSRSASCAATTAAYRAVKAALDDGEHRRAAAAALRAPQRRRCPTRSTSDMAITDPAMHEIDTIRWMFDQEIGRRPWCSARARARGRGGPAATRSSLMFEMTDGARRRRRDLRQLPLRLRRPLRGRRRGRHRRAGDPSTGRRAARGPAGPSRSPADWRDRFVLRLRRRDAGVDRRDRAPAARRPARAPGTATRPRSWPTRRARPGGGRRILVEQVDRPALYR